MKKIGIMTWYKFQNYGTALQAVSLSKVMENEKYVPVFIQYTQKYETLFSVSFLLKKIAAQSSWKKEYQSVEKSKLYDAFLKKNIRETEPCESGSELEALNDEFAAFVCGSDQIWSSLCFDEKYFLPFVRDERKMIAYAPSFGVTKIENRLIREKMRTLINRFQYLSVRERQGAEIVSQLCSKEAEIVLDPTFLLNSDEWLFLTQNAELKMKEIPQQYMVCYFLGDYRKYRITVEKISKELKLPVYVIPCSVGQKKNCRCIPFEVGPEEFVQLIHNASYVCTDSFHGMLFSIQFHKPFSVFKRFKENEPYNQNSRIESLLSILKLQGRIVRRGCFSLDKNLIEGSFKKCDEVLVKERLKSKKYLLDALARAVEAKENYKINSVSQVNWCCGCGACACYCPANAITIRKDENGFERRYVNEEKCIQCGKCLRACPFYQIGAKPICEVQNMYGYKCADKAVLKASSSGGIGYDIAELTNRQGYWVSGCAYIREQDGAQHILISPGHVEEIKKIQGSKYIQSVTADIMNQIIELPKDSKLCFFGTPCQTAAVDKLLRLQGKRESAVLVDLVCHGVPSDILWRKYLTEKKEKYDLGEHPEVSFRSDQMSWRERCICVHGMNDKVYTKDEIHDDFYAFFRHGICYMEACYECPFREKSSADIRIGDFWGGRFINEKEGVSMVIPLNDKGKKVIEKLHGWKGLYPVSEYWSVQYPYNRPKPLVYEQIINELKDPDIYLKEIRKKQVRRSEQKEKLIKLKKKILSWTVKGGKNEK